MKPKIKFSKFAIFNAAYKGRPEANDDFIVLDKKEGRLLLFNIRSRSIFIVDREWLKDRKIRFVSFGGKMIDGEEW